MALKGVSGEMLRDTDIQARAPLLLVEDERDLADEIRAELQASGHRVNHAETVEEGLKAARSDGPGLLIVDRMLRGEDGLTIVEALREEGNAMPVLVISALTTVDDRIRGLKAGGDDYLVKPFALRELSARIEALLRRASDARATRLRVGPLEMDLVERKCTRDGELSICCRANSSCSNISCAGRGRSSPAPCCLKTSGTTNSCRRPM